MRANLFSLIAVLALFFFTIVVGCDSCADEDDDDCESDDDESPADDDTADDDQGDDDLLDDDTEQPYDPALCEPCMESFYDACQFDLELDGAEVSQDEAVLSCEDVEYLFWPCQIECCQEYGEACIDLYQCAQECAEE